MSFSISIIICISIKCRLRTYYPFAIDNEMALHPRRKHGRHIPLQVRNRTGGGGGDDDVETHHGTVKVLFFSEYVMRRPLMRDLLNEHRTYC